MSEFTKKEKRINHQENIRRTTKITITNLNKLDEEFKYHIDESYRKAAKTGEINPEKIAELYKQAKIIEQARNNLESVDRVSISTERNTPLSDVEKNKIYHYYSTGDYKQEELADIFGTNQSTVSRIISSKNRKNK